MSDTPTQNESDAQAAQQIPRPYIMYVPNVQYPQLHNNTQQPMMPQYTQIYGNNLQQPFIPSQQPQQFYYIPPPYQPQPVPVVKPIEPIPQPLKHTLIEKAGHKERKFYNVVVTLLQILQQLIALLLSIGSLNNQDMARINVEYNGDFTVIFYVCCALLPLSMMWSVMRVDKSMKRPFSVIAYSVFTISFVNIVQGIAAQFRYNLVGQYYCISIGYVIVVQLGLLGYLYQETEELNIKRCSAYVLVLPGILTVLFISMTQCDFEYYFYAMIISILYGFYYFYLINKINTDGLYKLRTNNLLISVVLIQTIMLMPFYKQDDEIPAVKTTPIDSDQQIQE